MNKTLFSFNRPLIKLPLYNLIGFLIIIITSGCASSGDIETQLDEKLAKETFTETASPIPAEALTAITTNNQLAPEEKTQLTNLVGKIMMDLGKTRSDIAKLKKILFANLVSGEDHRDENQLIKRRITELDKKRLDRMFAALDEAEKIIKNNRGIKPQSLEFLLDIDRYRMPDTLPVKK